MSTVNNRLAPLTPAAPALRAARLAPFEARVEAAHRRLDECKAAIAALPPLVVSLARPTTSARVEREEVYCMYLLARDVGEESARAAVESARALYARFSRLDWEALCASEDLEYALAE